jgi:hypothetical protein
MTTRVIQHFIKLFISVKRVELKNDCFDESEHKKKKTEFISPVNTLCTSILLLMIL